MFEQAANFINKKNIINLLFLGILILAIPLTVGLVRQQQILLSRAAAGEVKFLTKEEGGNDCITVRNGKKVAICKDVYVKIIAPSGSDIKTQPLSAQLPQTELVSKAYAQSNGCEAGYPQQCDFKLPRFGETIPGQQWCSPGVDLGNGVCGYNDSLAGQVTCGQCEPIGSPSGCNPNGDIDPNTWTFVPGPLGRVDDRGDQLTCISNSQSAQVWKCQDTTKYAWAGADSRCSAGGPTGIPVGQGGCCNTNADCNANNKQFSDNKSTEGWTCTDTNPSCQGGKACKAPSGSSKRAAGEPCTVDSDCQSNNCPSNPSNSSYHKCLQSSSADSGKKDEGQPCDSNDQCKSNSCGYRSSDSGSSVISKVSSLVGIVYAKGAGEACTKDSECDSGNCCAGPTCNPRGVCSGGGSPGTGTPGGTNKSNGEPCTKDSECSSGNCCAGPTCNPRNVCAPGGSSGGSSGRANGEACTTDSQCASGNCCAGPSCNPRNVCAPGGGGGDSRQKVCLSSGTEGPGGQLPSNCCSSPSAADCTNNRSNVPENLRSDFDKCVAGGKGGIVLPPGTPGAPEAPAALTITQFRKAETPSDLSSASFVSYPAGGTVVPFSFSNTQLGDKFIFVQFKDNKGGVTTPFSDKVQYVGPDPVISNSAACNLDLKDNSLVFKVEGQNFGAQTDSSTITADSTTLEPESWKDNKVVARMQNPPDVTKGKRYSIKLKRSDGAQATKDCKVDTTQIALGAKLFCRTQNNFDQDNVDMSIFQTQGVGVSGPQFVVTSKTAEKVTIGKDGVIQNIKTVLQEGVEYMICLKAPLSLRSCTDRFVASSGTNLIKDFVLPRGDLNADDTINSVDASSLKRQWGPVTGSSTKNCDFNRDGQCNSFEWGCMLKDFNTSSAKEPQ